jgi:hypothetical protein
VIWLSLVARSTVAQDLDPRAYAQAPTGLTLAIAGVSFSSGGVLTDPTAPVQNVRATVLTPSVGVARIFSLFGRTAQALAGFPYSWAQVAGDVGEQARHIDRSGLTDSRFRLSVLLAGAPAMTPQQFATARRRPIVGTSLTVGAPTGQYSPQRLINIGTNRWSFKPEVALSYPVGEKWLVDSYAGLWLFSRNASFYTGTGVRTQTPIGTLQMHISYSLSLKAWVAFDSTWYRGGQVLVDDVATGRHVSNSRVGATVVFPVGNRQAVRVGFSRGALIRTGSNFTTLSLGWQRGWLDRRPAQTP